MTGASLRGRLRLALLVGALCAWSTACDRALRGACADGSQPAGEAVPTIELRVKGETISVEVSRTAAQRQKGLMERRELAEMSGMLFVWPEAKPRAFWMHNVPIPLSVAFLDEDGTILQIEEMRPGRPCPRPGHILCHEDGRTYSRFSIRLAIEMSRGWFDLHGVRVGDRVEGLEKLAGLPPPKGAVHDEDEP